MRRGEDPHEGGFEWLGYDGDDGGEELLPGGPGPRRWPRWVPFVGVLAVAGLIAGVLISQQSSNRPVAVPTNSTSNSHPPAPIIPDFSGVPTGLPTSSSTLRTPSPQLTERKTIDVGHAILGITGKYELFARGQGVVKRIQFAEGRVTATPVPVVLSTGPVYFVVGTHAALVHPLDRVPSYLVPDGGAAVKLTGALGDGGPTFPGPDVSHVWVADPNDSNSLVLVDLRGHATSRTSITLPDGASAMGSRSDGSGYVLVHGADGVYAARPNGLTRITTGKVLATGPTGWLVRECDPNCTVVYVDRASGHRRAVHVDIDLSDATGVIAPDGDLAAVPEPDAGATVLHLINLSTGHDRTLDVRSSSRYGISQLVWSPDSRWLFVAGDHVSAVDARTGRVRDLSLLPVTLRVSQVAIRPAAAGR